MVKKVVVRYGTILLYPWGFVNPKLELKHQKETESTETGAFVILELFFSQNPVGQGDIGTCFRKIHL